MTSSTRLTWPETSVQSESIRSDLPWTLHPFEDADPAAKDLLRIAVAAFFADLSAPIPGVSRYRSIDLTVQLESVDVWSASVIQTVVDLLHWLTGDEWSLSVASAPAPPYVPHQAEFGRADRVQLLSGGLDSLCGALISQRQVRIRTLFVGHTDTARSVKHAQSAVRAVLRDPTSYQLFDIHPPSAASRRNHGPRSRSLMFMALGTAIASACGAGEVVVPENGFTSINPPLDASRGGTLTTRSTHPTTFSLVNGLLADIGLKSIDVVNPYGLLTKGELVAKAFATQPQQKWLPQAAESLSCAKLNNQFVKGGDANINCGLCVACVVRRAAFIRADVADSTDYLVDRLVGHALEGFVSDRRRDISALRKTTVGIEDNALFASASWPRGTDLRHRVGYDATEDESWLLYNSPTDFPNADAHAHIAPD